MNFVKIATVKASGNSATPKQYVLDGVDPTKGFNYYRIRQIDLDGWFSYSPARLVRFEVARLARAAYIVHVNFGHQ